MTRWTITTQIYTVNNYHNNANGAANKYITYN